MTSVFPEWMADLPMQQQSVLVLAARGPDGVRKHHPMKDIQRHYRATVLKAARYGRSLNVGERADSFMSAELLADRREWFLAQKAYFDHIDELPHHFHMHLMHGAEILGYKHPDPYIRERWNEFYLNCCDDAHLPVETEADMDKRLADWNREFWNG
jgi:hypothetical protein